MIPGVVRVRLATAGEPGERTVAVALAHRWRTVRLPSVQLDRRPECVPGEPEPLSVVEELAARVLDAVDPRDGAPWWVRAHLVRAIKRWDAQEPGALVECQRELETALRGDPLSPAVNYALGALGYNQYEAEPTRRAVTHLAVAYSAVGRLDASMAALSGLVLCGLALTHCQMYHRFGDETADVLATSRTAARMAVGTAAARRERLAGWFAPRRLRKAALEGFALAKYAEAFAQHITGTCEDAAAAIPLYEESIGLLEGARLPVRAVLYNNLGFQHMEVAGRFERGPDVESYETAGRMFRKAAEVFPDLYFAWANLGNMHRLRGEWDDATRCYLKSLEISKGLGTVYPQGHNELANVLAEAGREPEAAESHQRALDVAGSPSLRAKFRAEYGRSLLLVGRMHDARLSAELGMAEDPDNLHCRKLMDELRRDERQS
jgi:tetratricopeptide (TPR) repeat protein